jgi:hypothetical protein
MAKPTTHYKALTGLDTSDGQRFEMGDEFKAADIPKDALAAYLEMEVIEPIAEKVKTVEVSE